MSLIARPRVNSADTDTTDTDDGDAMVSAGDFWPAISLHEIRLASRIPGEDNNNPSVTCSNGSGRPCDRRTGALET